MPAFGLGVGAGAIADRLPGRGERPAQLPGLERGDRWEQIRDNRPDWASDRRQDLQNRLDNRQDFAKDWQQSRQDFLNDRREDWQNSLDDRYPWHGDWHHGYWQGQWGNYWEHMWAEHPVWSAFGVTSWALNAVGYTFGVWGYSNPYWDAGYAATSPYDYSEPIVIYSEPAVTVAAPATTEPIVATPAATEPAAAALPPGVTQAGLDQFDQARAAFYQGQYQQALELADAALRSMPGDAILHEFRALCLFALGQYRPAAATLNAVLAVGPGWDWTTMASLYPNVEVYTAQLRKLEDYARANPNAADASFVLAYHYLTAGHSSAAATELARVVQAVPGDAVAQQLYEMLTYKPSGEAPPKAAAEPTSGVKLSAEDLLGNWKAAGPGSARYEMTLAKGGEFAWKYTKGKKQQAVKGVFAVEGSTLAMEPESGGVMLADLTPKGKDSLEFRMVGAKENDPPLVFTR